MSLTQVADWFTAAACIAAAAFAAARSRVAFSGLISLGSELAVFVCNCKFVDGYTAVGYYESAGPHFAWSNQATPRVDVGGSPQASLQQAAAAFNPGLGAIEGYQGVREKGGCRDEVVQVCQNPGLLQVFVSGLDGRTLVLSCS